MSQEATETVHPHDGAWRIPSVTDPNEYGVLVRCGKPDDPYWWLVCPAAATLYFTVTDGDELLGCTDSSCLWVDVHAAAATAFRRIREAKT